ncbi:prepilin peptidase [Pseudodesulfovibrio cashew]|uniref:Prepilin leader peptidase/N-methyltransferase n=1 Tax=Pseudodesulfovibrio cashew TaxID=2678688 RepID=A0A6I6JK69_9BACT|nr:A24 family peptidase [Pseudodesulfovibrio cashew]QGY40507.1 prepilin peptidase [Pseudodesulfovibrio cashew]
MEYVPLWAFYLGAAVLGLELGGLATIFVQRWMAESPILRPGRSRCPVCGEKLGWRDTIPLLSYFLLRGRCRHCDTAIGLQYPLVEVACLAWSLALAHVDGMTLAWGVHLVLGCMLIAGSIIDFETFLLPNRITLGGAALALAACFVLDKPGWQNGVLGAVAGGGFFWVLQQGYRLWRKDEGLGTGDVKLMLMIGAMTGLTGLPLTVLAAAVTSAVGSVIFMLRPEGRGLKTRIPFGPFLSLGCMLYILYGEPVMRWWVAR